MAEAGSYWDQLLLVVLPYVALFTFFLVTILRYRQRTFTYSSLSSQFLENDQHFWALVPFHFGIIVVLVGHVVAFLLPRTLLAWNGHPLRLWVLEVSALAFGLLALVGMAMIALRRGSNAKLRRVTSWADWVIFALLLFQIATGVAVAVFHPWGSNWFASAAAPYLWSIAKLNPQTAYVATWPLLPKLHLLGAWLLIGFFPFSRLVHILVIPNMYLWRRPQVVRWWRPASSRESHRSGRSRHAG